MKNDYIPFLRKYIKSAMSQFLLYLELILELF